MQTFGHRYWVTEMHVDGFRFDLASIMTRGSRLLADLFVCMLDFCIDTYLIIHPFPLLWTVCGMQ